MSSETDTIRKVTHCIQTGKPEPVETPVDDDRRPGTPTDDTVLEYDPLTEHDSNGQA